jgi:hypothetical protein
MGSACTNPESVESTLQSRGLEKTAGYGKAAQIIQRNYLVQNELNLCLSRRTRYVRSVSLLKNINGFTKATPVVKGSAFRSGPENNRVGALSAAPGKRFI